MNERSNEWKIQQFNRNRSPEDQVKTIEEMSNKIKELYPDMMGGKPKYIYESPDGGTTIYQRKLGDYDNKNQLNLFDNSIQLELFDE